MKTEIVQQLYIKAYAQCALKATGEAWAWEKAFAEIIVEECMRIAKEESYNDHQDINDSIRYYFGMNHV